MRGAWALAAAGILLLLLALVASLAGTRGALERVEGSGLVRDGQVAGLDSIIGVPEGLAIVNGTLSVENIGNTTAIVIIGTLESPNLLELRPGESQTLNIGPGYTVSLHSRGGSEAVVSIKFSGWARQGPGTGMVMLSLLLLIGGSILLALGVIVNFLYHMEKSRAG